MFASPDQLLASVQPPANAVNIPAALYDQLQESVAVYIVDGRLLYLNPATENLFGKSRGDLSGKILWEVFPEARGKVFCQAFNRVAQTGRAFEAERLVSLQLKVLEKFSRSVGEASFDLAGALNAIAGAVVEELADSCVVIHVDSAPERGARFEISLPL